MRVNYKAISVDLATDYGLGFGSQESPRIELWQGVEDDLLAPELKADLEELRQAVAKSASLTADLKEKNLTKVLSLPKERVKELGWAKLAEFCEQPQIPESVKNDLAAFDSKLLAFLQKRLSGLYEKATSLTVIDGEVAIPGFGWLVSQSNLKSAIGTTILGGGDNPEITSGTWEEILLQVSKKIGKSISYWWESTPPERIYEFTAHPDGRVDRPEKKNVA